MKWILWIYIELNTPNGFVNLDVPMMHNTLEECLVSGMEFETIYGGDYKCSEIRFYEQSHNT